MEGHENERHQVQRYLQQQTDPTPKSSTESQPTHSSKRIRGLMLKSCKDCNKDGRNRHHHLQDRDEQMQRIDS